MKQWVFAAATLAITLSTGISAACGVGEAPRRPVVHGVSFQVSELVERATALESEATSHEQSAAAFDRQADLLASRVRLLRNQAVLVSTMDRGNLLAVAEELAARMADERQQASEERSQASSLRQQARRIRERAAELVRVNGGGWRGRPVPKSSVVDRVI